MTRAALVAALCDELRARIRVAKDRAKATAASATHAESKAENDKDTRALEETYLAAGQAQRVAQLELDLAEVRSLADPPSADGIAVGAVVELEGEAGARRLLVAGRAGGLAVTLDGESVQVVTPGSPLGRALIGREEGDEVTLKLKGGLRTYEITSVA